MQQAQLEQARGLQEQQVEQMDEYLKQGLPLESFPAFATDATLNNLKTERLILQSDYAGLATSSSASPQLESKKAQLAEINKQIQQQVQMLTEGRGSQLAAIKIQEQQELKLRTEMQDILQNSHQISQKRAEWVHSFGDITTMKRMIAGDTNSPTRHGSAIVVVNRAAPADRAISPRLWLNLRWEFLRAAWPVC